MPVSIVCPFYSYTDDDLTIHCEGAAKSFNDKLDLKLHVLNYCANLQNWEVCPIAALIYKKYNHPERELDMNREQKRKQEQSINAVDRYKRKVSNLIQEKLNLANQVSILEAQVKSASMFISVLSARVFGLTIPTEGEVVIPKNDLTKAVTGQRVDWYEDKKNNSIVIRLLKVKPKVVKPNE